MMKNKLIKNKTIALITIALLMISALAIIGNVSVYAQLAEQPVSGPLPDGVTVDVEAYSQAYLSYRPNVVGLNQIFLVNLWVTPAP